MNLSVVIPTYNTSGLTGRCCEAVFEALPPSSEVIVVDDGSTDSTGARIAADFPRVSLIRNETNLGFARSANRGVEAARGEVVMLLNSDTRVDRESLSRIVEAFAREARLGVAGAQLVDEDGSAQWSGGRTPTILWLAVMVSGFATMLSRRRPRRNVPTSSGPRPVDWVSGAAMAFRRELWTPLREDFRFYAQDLDFCLKARAKGWDVCVLPDVRVIHLHGATIAGEDALHAAPELLWSDLLQWGSDHYGAAWGRRARFVMRSAAALRIAVRVATRADPEVTARYRRARAAL